MGALANAFPPRAVMTGVILWESHWIHPWNDTRRLDSVPPALSASKRAFRQGMTHGCPNCT